MNSRPLPGTGVDEALPVGKAALLLIGATAAAYGAALFAPFVYDDRVWVTGNPFIRHLGALWQVLWPPADAMTRGRPFLSLSFALNYALSGNNPWSYHAANLAIHCGCALLLMGIVRRTLALLPGTFPTPRDSFVPAVGAALLWAVHPLQTEAVTYVSQRAESLMGLFYFLTLYAFVRGATSGRPRDWYLLATVSCLLGAATKETMVSAPLVVLAYDRTFVSGSFRRALSCRWALYAARGLSWVAVALLGAGLHSRGVGFGLGYSAGGYALVEAWVVAHYLLLCVWPYPLVFDRGTDLVATVGEAIPWACVTAVAIAVAACGFVRRSAWGFACAWFFLVLAPTSSVVPIAFQPMAEHRMYLPLAAIAALAGACLWRFFGKRAISFTVAACALLAAVTFLRNGDYRDEVGLWSDTVRRVPGNERAHLALGEALTRAGRGADAEQQYRRALGISPGDSDARLALGLSLFGEGRAEEALGEYRKIAASGPDSSLLHRSMGLALEKTGRRAEALAEFRRALEVDPSDAVLRERLGLPAATP